MAGYIKRWGTAIMSPTLVVETFSQSEYSRSHITLVYMSEPLQDSYSSLSSNSVPPHQHHHHVAIMHLGNMFHFSLTHPEVSSVVPGAFCLLVCRYYSLSPPSPKQDDIMPL
jgi:hypothetical protein